MDTVLLRYKYIRSLYWAHVETLPDDGRVLLNVPHLPRRDTNIILRATVHDDVRAALCAWELYGVAPAQIPFAQLGAFESARQQLRIDYALDRGTETRDHLPYLAHGDPLHASSTQKRPRGRPRKMSVTPPDSA